eukprot:2242061-Amphidinium_carterae.1
MHGVPTPICDLQATPTSHSHAVMGYWIRMNRTKDLVPRMVAKHHGINFCNCELQKGMRATCIVLIYHIVPLEPRLFLFLKDSHGKDSHSFQNKNLHKTTKISY